MGSHPSLPRCNNQFRWTYGSQIPAGSFRSKSLAWVQFDYLPLVSNFGATPTTWSLVSRKLNFIYHWEYHLGRDLGNQKQSGELEGQFDPLLHPRYLFSYRIDSGSSSSSVSSPLSGVL